MKNQIFTKRKLTQSITQYALITIFILVIGGYFGYRNYTEYQAARVAYDAEMISLSELRGTAETAKTNYLYIKKEMDAENAGVNESIEKILPSNEDFTDLARSLDKYFLNTKSTANELFLSNLSFGAPLIADTEFAVLPLSMSMTGDETGFKEFLQFIEKSGDLNDETRLLDFSNVSISFTGDESPAGTENGSAYIASPIRKLNASLNLKAYFQKPVEVTQNNQ